MGWFRRRHPCLRFTLLNLLYKIVNFSIHYMQPLGGQREYIDFKPMEQQGKKEKEQMECGF